MALRDINYFKNRFKTGDRPSQATFHDLMDTLFYSPLVVNMTGSIVVDPNPSPQNLDFEVDISTSQDFSSFVLRAQTKLIGDQSSSSSSLGLQSHSSSSSSGSEQQWPVVPATVTWEFWNGVRMVTMSSSGLPPVYQSATTGLVTMTWTGPQKNTTYYVRYRSGFDYIWSDYRVEKLQS